MKKKNKYRETLDYLYNQLPMFQRIGKAAFKKDLTNIIKLCEALDNPQLKFPSIHIAGTNGKGSVAHLLSAVLQAQGLKTGLYTSPHYKDFRERIKINGKYMPQEAVIDFVENNKALFHTIKPSFFEITVALAFDHFSKSGVDIAIVETGLGGRLDSTNILNPVLSIITNISFDHESFLGNTLVEIAGEKAGIIKQGTPVVIGASHPQTRPVFEAKAKAMNAPIYFADQHYKAQVLSVDTKHSIFSIRQKGHLLFSDLKVNIHGDYQRENLQTVLQALDLLKKDWPIELEKTKLGFKNLKALTNFLGRWQILQHAPTILCDSAHNEAGLKAVLKQLSSLKFNQLHIVLGMVNDKKVEKILALFPKNARYYFAKADIPRGLDASVLKEKANTLELKGRAYVSVVNALKAAKRQAKAEDLIFVGGSIFVVAEVV